MENDEDFPVILGRNIGISTYHSLSLQMRFRSIISINPTYPLALELFNWDKANKGVFSSQLLGSSSGSSTPVTVTPVHQQVIFIAEMTSQASVGIFYVEAEISILNDLQQFCVLECLECHKKKGTKERKPFDCPRCQQITILVPRYVFQIDISDGSGSTTAYISGDLAENLLSMTANNIFETTCI